MLTIPKDYNINTADFGEKLLKLGQMEKLTKDIDSNIRPGINVVGDKHYKYLAEPREIR